MSSLGTWPQEPTDFALVCKDGETFNCHKARLVESSKYFEAMLRNKMRETAYNKMEVPEYDRLTVASFLEWIYAPKISEKIMKKLKDSAEPGDFFPQRQFDLVKFTPGIFISMVLVEVDFFQLKGNLRCTRLFNKL